jgi:glycosyltransferase involved in cell wall biosynthesis
MNLAIDIVSETYPPEVNGVAMTVGRLVEGLRGRGYAVTVLRPRQFRQELPSRDEIPLAGLPLPGYPGLRLGLPAGGALRRRWRARRPDLVHVVTEGPLGWSAVSAARSLGIPVTSGFHTNFDHYSTHYGLGWLRPAVGAYLRTLHRRTCATLVPTAALAADLACAGIPGVKVVGRGVDTSLFDPRRRSEVLRMSWDAGPRTVVCLSVGRLAPEKNLGLVSRSLQDLPGDVRMVWVGDGPARGALEQKHPDHVFAGVRRGEELAAHYASADIFLFSSLTETYGNVVAEAMASGLAVAAYRTAAAAELISPERDGLAVPPGDEVAFTAAAARLAEDSGLRQRLGSTARLAMLPRSWEQVVGQFETAILEAIYRPVGAPG